MAIKKSELYSTLWKSCDELRGGMDASQYKDYVLSLLFVKYVSDKYTCKKDSLIDIPEGGSFTDMVALKGDKEIGDKINKIISKLAEANGLKGVIDLTDFNNEDKLGKGKDMQDRLSNLVSIFESKFDFGKNRADGDDLLGDAYEYLMKNFATQSGKSKGQFYTPSEVSRVMAKVIGINEAKRQDQTIYDPTCGSGSLLLKAVDETEHGITIYGQEMDNATKALAVMNMWLHGNPMAEIWQDNTLSNPHFKNTDGTLKTFDFAVANPPFSVKSWSTGFDPNNDLYQRFSSYGIPPDKNGDYAFLLHIIRSLKSTGKGAIILPHGVLFRGGSELEIRKNIILKGYIKGIIGLPANLFYGTGIPACIIIIDKENAESRKGIFMMDASKGYIKDGNKNRLRYQDIHKIVDTFNKQIELPKYSRQVPLAEVETNEYNLNIPRYINTSEDEDIQNIEAHLHGGIPNADIEKLEAYWSEFHLLKNILFRPSARVGFMELALAPEDIKTTIYGHSEFTTYIRQIHTVFGGWKTTTTPILKNLEMGTHPKSLIHELSEHLLTTFEKLHLIDVYDMYQHLMDYWNETMQDDIYTISSDGWKAEITYVQDKKGNAKKDDYDCDLLPKYLVINRYFASEKEILEKLQSKSERITSEIDTLVEEQSGEDGYFADFDKVNSASVTTRIKAIKKSPSDVEELQIMETYIKLTEQNTVLTKKIKDDKNDLDTKVTERYKTLTEEEIKTLVVDDKWIASIETAMKQELDRVSQTLTGSINELAKRYESTLSELSTKTDEYTEKVNAHLVKMGFSI